MAENKPLPQREPQFRHENTDVDTWAVGRFGIALVLLCVLSLAGLFGLFRYFEARQGGPVAVTMPRRPEGSPLLEENPVLDLARERAAEGKLLNSYGWVDRQQGVARIPIGRAIDLLAERGLPSRQPPEQASASAATVPTASGMGSVMQRPGGPLGGGSK
jgi:hypothetical protein